MIVILIVARLNGASEFLKADYSALFSLLGLSEKGLKWSDFQCVFKVKVNTLIL